MRYINTFFLLFFLFGFSQPVFFVFAESKDPATPLTACQFIESWGKTANSSDSGAKTPENKAEIPLDLAARKQIFLKIVECATTEIKNLDAGVRSFATKDANIQTTKNLFSKLLEQAVQYYEIQKIKITSSRTIEETKVIAKETKEWRAVFSLDLERITYFVLWSKNQELLESAEKRLDHIAQTINVLKLSDNPAVAPLLKETRQEFLDAKTANELARGVFISPVSYADAPEFIKKTLEELTGLYKNFFSLSEAINKLLPQY